MNDNIRANDDAEAEIDDKSLEAVAGGSRYWKTVPGAEPIPFPLPDPTTDPVTYPVPDAEIIGFIGD